MINVSKALKLTLFKRSIVRTMLLSYLVANILLISSLGYLTLRDTTSLFTEEIINSSKKVMEQATVGLNFNLEEVKRALVLMGTHPSVIASLNSFHLMNAAERINHERLITDASRSISSSLISDVLIIGINGYIMNLDGRRSLKWDYDFRQQPWFQKTVELPQNNFITLGLHKQDYYLNDYASKYNQQTLSVAIPILNFEQKVVGSIVCNIDLDHLNGLFDLSASEYSGSMFLIDKDEQIIVHKNKSLIGTQFSIAAGQREGKNNFIADIDGQDYLVIYHPATIGDWKLVSAVPMSEIRKHTSPLGKNLQSILYLGFALNICLGVVITIRISRPVNKLLRTLDKTGNESLVIRPFDYRYSELNQIGMKFEDLIGRIKLLIDQNYISQITLKETEFKALQSQINPHFLFNTLQLLQTEIVYGNNEESNQIIVSLSNLLRYSMNHANEVVSLQHEINNVKDYLFILHKKFSGNLTVRYNIPDAAVFEHRTLKLLLQPIVENCIKHGFQEAPYNNEIYISATIVRKGILVLIQDNGIGMAKAELNRLRQRINEASYQPRNHIGLDNVNHRIHLKYGSGYGIFIRSKEGAYTKVYMLLPRTE
ncbi:sensor histidine kinase [Paenibacillus radicis (ex Xue et al. 2023)]|uniref:Cache domain-containing protein n=1 Tax=Paenibacillus radicis (ex Xue et al. 2023) TaxID=2972489 RepID=A0ABT1YMB6_9BACL|nr:sensor histidine kinase [Paenibacillus radicis (ex Xue et al. 2023)]MCR8634307.1 cache domain-containing protein [Paenibacillus radicis (ex Xue et al. 2023)]